MKEVFMNYDPWSRLVSRNGIPGDELVSGLQKSIRRGLEVQAVQIAYEMYITSEQFEDKLWRRLLAISVEDVGEGNPDAPSFVNNLDDIRRKFPYTDGDRPIFFVHAIRFLCSCQKDRSTDHLKNITIKNAEQGFKPTIPDYAIDMHTQRGIKEGKDEKHFLEHASMVTNEKAVENTYKEELKGILESLKDKEPVPGAFKFNNWQH